MTNENHRNGTGNDNSGQGADARVPVFNIPQALVVVTGFMLLVFVVENYFLSVDGQNRLLFTFAFLPLRYVVPFASQDGEWLWTPLTYSFLHGGIEHLVFNSLWLLAFGVPVLRRIGTWRFALFWCLSAAVSAFGHAALHWGEDTILIGASGVVSALMGAACRFAFPPGGAFDRQYGHLYPRQSIAAVFSNRTVVIFTALWFAGNLLIAFGIPLIGADAEIAWDAHIGGFLFGFLLFGLFDPVRWPDRNLQDRG